MSREYMNDNSRGRTDIHEPPIRTIKFKTLFTSYEEFKSKLSVFGFKDESITSGEFMILESMIANSYLKYKTDVKNLGHIAYCIQRDYAKRQREEILYNKSLDLLLASVSDNEQKFYTINRSDVGVVTDTFLDNSIRSTLTNKEPMINKLTEIAEFNKMELPGLVYLTRIVNTILYPLQPQQRTTRLGGHYGN